MEGRQPRSAHPGVGGLATASKGRSRWPAVRVSVRQTAGAAAGPRLREGLPWAVSESRDKSQAEFFGPGGSTSLIPPG